jgi:cytochrome b561
MTYFEPKDEDLRFLLYDVHRSIGLVLFVQALFRLSRRSCPA